MHPRVVQQCMNQIPSIGVMYFIDPPFSYSCTPELYTVLMHSKNKRIDNAKANRLEPVQRPMVRFIPHIGMIETHSRVAQ